MNKVLSVIIPSYNAEKYIDETLPHFLCDEIIEDIQIILVNDGSKDRTSSIAHSYEEKYPNTIVVVDKENGGHGSTINTGIRIATGKFVKVVDVDDWVDSKEFISFISFLKNTDADMILSPYNRVNIDTGIVEKKANYTMIPYNVYSFEEAYPFLRQEYAMHSITFNRVTLKGIKQLDEHCFYVDQEYILYPLYNIETIVFAPFTIYQYRVGTNEQSMNIKNMQKNREMHGRVIDSLISFYHEHENENEIKSKFLREKIGSLCNTQITILLSMKPGGKICQELDVFVRKIESDSEIYDQINSKRGKVIKKYRSFAYYPMSWYIRFANKIK